jgi:hypothetical protein
MSAIKLLDGEEGLAKKKPAKPKAALIPEEIVAPYEGDSLSPNRELFCQEYAIDRNATRAYQTVYQCGKKTAEVNGSRLLGIAEVKNRIDQLLSERVERTQITADYVLATVRDTIERCRQARPVLNQFGQQVLIDSPDGAGLVPAYTFMPKEVLKGCEVLLRYINVPPLTSPAPTNPSSPNSSKRSFEDFCEKAGYPRPFAKQVEMKDFIVYGSLDGKISEVPRMLLGSRGIGKSEYSTILGLAYAIYLDPNDTTTLSTKVEKNGRRMLKAISRALEANGVVITIDNADELRVNGCTKKEHNIMLVPVGSAGFRTMHPKRVLFDDPVVPGRVSEADRDELKVAYEEAIKLTQNVAIIGQPVDFRDLYSKLRGIVKTMEVPYGTIPELDHDLDVQRAAGVEEKSIQASYFLKVEPEGDATFHDIERIEKFPDTESIAFIDPSDGGDYTALGIFTGHFTGMAIVGFAWKKAWHLCIPEIKKKLAQFKVHKLGFETNKHGLLPLQVLRENLHDLNITVEGKYTHSNKEMRIQAAAQFSKNLYLSKESDKEYTRQVIEYSHDAKFDDSPDTIASFLEWAGKIRPPKAIKDPSKDL